MDALYIGISLSCLTSLGWLSYQHPLYAIKLLSFILVFAITAQMLFNKYQSVRQENDSTLEKSILHQLTSLDSLSSKHVSRIGKSKLQKMRQEIAQALDNSADRVKNINKDCTDISHVMYCALLVLYVFSTISPKLGFRK